MSRWKVLFGRGESSPETGYGLGPDSPVLCGGGPEGEFNYLNRLRCPSGASVRYSRRGSTSTTNVGFLARPGVIFDAGPRVSRRREEMYSQEVSLDLYLVECECGKHRLKVFMDMYHRGPSEPIGQRGWTLASAPEPNATPPPPLPECPYCGKPLRTERAKQCFECGKDWHDPDKVV